MTAHRDGPAALALGKPSEYTVDDRIGGTHTRAYLAPLSAPALSAFSPALLLTSPTIETRFQETFLMPSSTRTSSSTLTTRSPPSLTESARRPRSTRRSSPSCASLASALTCYGILAEAQADKRYWVSDCSDQQEIHTHHQHVAPAVSRHVQEDISEDHATRYRSQGQFSHQQTVGEQTHSTSVNAPIVREHVVRSLPASP